jgi:hypothetical protein
VKNNADERTPLHKEGLFFMFNFCFNNPTQRSLEEVVSNVIVKILFSIPHSCSKLYIFSDKDKQLCGGGINEKFNSLLVNTQYLLIKCAVRHIWYFCDQNYQ